MAEPVTVSLFTDYACPWCYLGRARLRRVTYRPVAVRTVHFPLSPDTPPEGRALKPYLKARGVDVESVTARLKALMDLEGLAWNVDPDRMTWNTRLAQELAVWAEPKVGEAVHDALFHAYQVEGRQLSDVDVLVDIAKGLGLDEGEARAVLTDRRFQAKVDEDGAIAKAMGVTSVPTYVVGQRGVVGAQPVEALEKLIRG